jgi:hypothetical protein
VAAAGSERRRALALAVGAVAVAGLCAAAIFNMGPPLARAADGFISPAWSEGPLLLELRRMAAGQAPYTPPVLANAYDYGPGYVFALDAIRALFARGPSVVLLRYISMAFGLLAAVPLAIASAFVALRAKAGGPLAIGTAAACGAVLGADCIMRNTTFEMLHPDDLVFTLIASALALHFGIAARRIMPAFAWGIVGFGVAATLTKQNALALAPLLLIGLCAAGAIGVRLLVATLLATAAATVAAVAAMPPAMRAWTVAVPLAHRYQLTWDKGGDAVAAFVLREPYVGATIVLALPALALLRRNAGARAMWADGAAAAAVALTAFSAFFKELGISNNVAVVAALAAPYAGALVAAIATGRRPLAAACGTLVAAAVLGFALTNYSGDVHPALAVPIAQDQRRMEALVAELCAGHEPIVALTIFPEFLDCPSVRYALGASLTELQLAYPRYDPGATVFDRPLDARYVITPETLGLPDAWSSGYRQIYPAIMRGGPGRYRLHLALYERIGAHGAPVTTGSGPR